MMCVISLGEHALNDAFGSLNLSPPGRPTQPEMQSGCSSPGLPLQQLVQQPASKQRYKVVVFR